MIANLTRIGLRQGFGRQVGIRQGFGRQVGRIALAIALLVVPGATQALTSASYILEDEVPNYGERVNAASTSYRLNEAGITWSALPLTSASYRIVTAPPATSAGAAGAVQSADSGQVRPEHGGRRSAGGVSFGRGIGSPSIRGPAIRGPLGKPAAPGLTAPTSRTGIPNAPLGHQMHYKQKGSPQESRTQGAPRGQASPRAEQKQRGNAPAATQQRGADHSGVQRKRGAHRVGLRGSLLDARAAFSAPDWRDIVAIVASLAILGWMVLRFLRALEHVIARFSPLNLIPRPNPVPRKKAPKTRSPFVIRPV